MLHLEGAGPHNRKPRLSLPTRRGPNSSKLAGVESFNNSAIADETQGFEAWLRSARNTWDIQRRRGGLFVPQRQLDKSGAERLLRSMLADLAAGGGE